jgi:indole-3-glycerol phosphate synthase
MTAHGALVRAPVSTCRPRNTNTRRRRVLAAGSGASEGGQQADDDSLAAIIMRRKDSVEMAVRALGDDGLEERLSSAALAASRTGDNAAFPFSRKLVSEGTRRGGPLVIYEIRRFDPEDTSEALAARAVRLVEAGADAISVRIDQESSPAGEKDLFLVSRAVNGRVPVFARDFFIHPLQICDAKMAGATGVIGITASVTGRGTPILSSYAASLGLDAPVEIVNAQELDQMEGAGVPSYSMDIQVAINVRVAGVSQQILSGVLGNLPFDACSIVGVKSMDELPPRVQLADGIYLKGEACRQEGLAILEEELVARVVSLTNGD